MDFKICKCGGKFDKQHESLKLLICNKCGKNLNNHLQELEYEKKYPGYEIAYDIENSQYWINKPTMIINLGGRIGIVEQNYIKNIYFMGLDVANNNDKGTLCSFENMKKIFEENNVKKVCTMCGQRIGNSEHICNEKYKEEYQKELDDSWVKFRRIVPTPTPAPVTELQDDIDCEYTDEIVCPHCGYKYECSYEMFTGQETETTEKCIECGKEFIANYETEVTYCTYKK